MSHRILAISLFMFFIPFMTYAGQSHALESQQVTSVTEVPDEAAPHRTGLDTSQSEDMEATPAEDSLEVRIQNLKEEVLELNTLLFRLEEALLFPEESSVVVFLSVEGAHYFKIDSIKLHIDDTMVSSYLYTDREIMALKKGGIQRLYTGNIRSGKHQLRVTFNGVGPQSIDSKRAQIIPLVKGKSATFVKLIIRDELGQKQPEFAYETWE